MYEMVGRLGDPDLRFPSNRPSMLSECLPVQEGGHVDDVSGTARGQVLKLEQPLRIDGSIRVDRLDQEDPILSGRIRHNVRQFSVRQFEELQLLQTFGIEQSILVGCVADIEY